MVGKSRVYPDGVLHHYILFPNFTSVVDFFSKRYRGVLRDTGTPGTSREDTISNYADRETQTRNSLIRNRVL